MSMCPYKWFLYLGTILGIAYVCIEAWMQFRNGPEKTAEQNNDIQEEEEEEEEEELEEDEQQISDESDESDEFDDDDDDEIKKEKENNSTILLYNSQNKLWDGLYSSVHSLRYRAQTLIRHNPQPANVVSR